ncbi:aspartate/glutamate racemase family protein [Phenylobacterium sp.]|uniref:aspartate/glutamate racemase family protein n=1 Tax=Phenylobacterium sp. TaxID=1871053 RepID=UPI0025F362AE|nr:aspartate/glutamate racemase family protein [Phenylobacterium sp.]
MKTLGLIGGISAESTTVYYQQLTRLVRERLGGLHSCELILWSVDFAPMAELQAREDWEAAGVILADAAAKLEAAGAEAIIICSNTVHLNAPHIRAAVSIPLIHIADATAQALRARGVTRPLLLATRFTMEKAFYRDRLAELGVTALTPDKADRDRLHAIIYDELCQGVIRPESKAEVLGIIARGQAAGADGLIFGCTEIGLLLDPADMPLPTVDTALAHAEAAVEFALGRGRSLERVRRKWIPVSPPDAL